MHLWRISKYADLTGRGGVLLEGRWHRKGIPVVYCSDHPSTSLLEVLVHFEPDQIPPSFQLIKIRCPDEVSIFNQIERAPELNRREKELWELIATGTPVEVLADQLGISLKTVEAYIKSIQDKMPATSDLPTALAELMQKPIENKQLSQSIGMKWLENNQYCLMRVPSFVMPAANNYLVNPRHSQASEIVVEDVISYPFDSRLLR